MIRAIGSQQRARPQFTLAGVVAHLDLVPGLVLGPELLPATERLAGANMVQAAEVVGVDDRNRRVPRRRCRERVHLLLRADEVNAVHRSPPVRPMSTSRPP